jgi:hypothetical protein
MSDKERVAKACKMDIAHLDRLIAMKRFAGKSKEDIERDLMQIAWLNGNKLVFVNTHHSN